MLKIFNIDFCFEDLVKNLIIFEELLLILIIWFVFWDELDVIFGLIEFLLLILFIELIYEIGLLVGKVLINLNLVLLILNFVFDIVVIFIFFVLVKILFVNLI